MKDELPVGFWVSIWFLFVVCCLVISVNRCNGGIVDVRVSGPITEVFDEPPGCPLVGEHVEFLAQTHISSKGHAVESLFTGKLNDTYDGLADWSTRFQLVGWPPDDGVEPISFSGTYERKAGGLGSVSGTRYWAEAYLNQGRLNCGLWVAPLEWDYSMAYHDGDANKDGLFNSADLVQVFVDGSYESNQQISTWATGDWTGDGFFDSTDLVAAFISGTYTASAQPVPEPQHHWDLLAVLGVLFITWRYR